MLVEKLIPLLIRYYYNREHQIVFETFLRSSIQFITKAVQLYGQLHT